MDSLTKLAHKMPREGAFLTSHQKVKEKSLSKNIHHKQTKEESCEVFELVQRFTPWVVF